jgi:SAM-dependent methyltransferase
VVDLHDGLDNDNALDQLAALIALSGLEAESTRNSRHGLGPRTLKRNTIRSYNAIAEKFASQWFEHPPVLALEKLLRRLPRRAAVLDAGCGPGHHAKLIAKSGHEIIGVDLSARMLEIARKSVRSVRFEKMDMQCLTFPRHTFDAIWCAGAALHIPREEMIQLLSGYRRVMRPGSILGINLQVGRQSEVINFGEDRRFFEYYRDSSEIAELLSLSGFSVEARDYGETTRNTHEVDIKLRWATLYARPNGEPSRAHGYAGVLPSQEFKLAGDLPTGGMGNE